jgi:CBS domain-containing protein
MMAANTLVRDVMTPDVVTLRPEQSIADAADVMAVHRFGAMPVVDASGALVGLLRDSDLIVSEARVHVPTFLNILGASIPLPGEMAHVQEELHKVAGSTVGEVMDDDPLTILPDDTLEELATRMSEDEVSHVPVIDAAGRLVGIVARGDIVKFIARTT